MQVWASSLVDTAHCPQYESAGNAGVSKEPKFLAEMVAFISDFPLNMIL